MKNITSPLSFLALSIIIISSFLISFSTQKWKNCEILKWDSYGYYNYLPATFLYNDIGNMNFLDSIEKKYSPTGGSFSKYGIHKSKSTNYSCNQYPVGVAIFELPFFIIAHAWCKITNQYSADGYSSPYQHAVAFSTLFFVLIGLFFLQKFLLNFFSDLSVAITLLIIYFGTNLYSYTVSDPGLSHPYLFFVSCLLLIQTYNWYKEATVSNSIFIGICIGIAAITRPIDALIFIFPLFWGYKSDFNTFSKKDYLLKNIKYLFIIVVATFLTTLPMLFYWEFTTNHWLYYSYTSHDYFEFNRLRIIEGLFSYRKGWFVYSPLLLLGFLGIFFIPKKHPLNFYKLPFAIFFALIIYLVFSWHNWIYGWSFGCRALIQTIPFLAIPMCFVNEKIFEKSKKLFIVYIIIVLLFISLSLFQTWQYSKSTIHGTMMNKKYYWRIFLKPSASESDLKIISDLEKYNWEHQINY